MLENKKAIVLIMLNDKLSTFEVFNSESAAMEYVKTQEGDANCTDLFSFVILNECGLNRINAAFKG